MLNSYRIEKFFENNPKGFIELVQKDGNNFRLSKDVAFSLDMTSITFINITYSNRNCGNFIVKKGNFVLPFKDIIRIEYVKEEYER